MSFVVDYEAQCGVQPKDISVCYFILNDIAAYILTLFVVLDIADRCGHYGSHTHTVQRACLHRA